MQHSNKLAARRNAWGLTQDEVGSIIGMSPHSVGNYEVGDRVPSLATAIALGLLYGHPVERLFSDLVHAVADRMSHAAAEWSVAVEAMPAEAVGKRQELLKVLGERLAHITINA